MLALTLVADASGSVQRESSATIKNPPIAYKHESPPKRQKIIEFDCRGLEFIDFKADGEWHATGLESNSAFTGIDLQDDWYDYDEKAGEEVSIKDIKWEIRRS
ncbi:MAG: DEAH-box ATP-dependent RNA helicase prp43 [Chaenotheca gracillima]|nr:MAG: DEAH-box ATP-dependent RNA helicase prp43 [Chaenotheca gracillima]